MADLIPYTIIMERIKDDIDFIVEQAYERGKRDILDQLQTTQTERKTGHWIINSDGYYPYCSECRMEPKSGDMTDFCPNCGADMRGKQNVD